MPNKSFYFKQFSILHQAKGLRVTTDACLLGALAVKNNSTLILDIGTGTGVIALMLAQKYAKAQISAIDIQAEIIHQAQLNIEHSIFKDRIELILANITTLELSNKYDLIVCNPPFFDNHLAHSITNKHLALHTETLNASELYQAVIKYLKSNGTFWVIYPPYQFSQFTEIATELTLIEKINIYNKPHKLHRIIGCFIPKNNNPMIEKNLILCNENNERTVEFSQLMKDFYL